MSQFEVLKKDLLSAPKTWLITGVAGFIGCRNYWIVVPDSQTGDTGSADECRDVGISIFCFNGDGYIDTSSLYGADYRT